IDQPADATTAPRKTIVVRSHVARVSCGFASSHAAAHIRPMADASTAASTVAASAFAAIAVKPHVSRTTMIDDGTETASTAASEPADRRSIHAVAAQNARMPVPGVIFARLCASAY